MNLGDIRNWNKSALRNHKMFLNVPRHLGTAWLQWPDARHSRVDGPLNLYPHEHEKTARPISKNDTIKKIKIIQQGREWRKCDEKITPSTCI